MKKIYFQDNVLYYFGSPAGYLADGKAVIDAMFHREELIRYLAESEGKEVVVKEGIYDGLPDGMYPSGKAPEAGATGMAGHQEKAPQGRTVRIFRLKPGQPDTARFASLSDREKRGLGRPERREYEPVHEGPAPSLDLEEIWDHYCRKELGEYPLSISDVVEISDGGASRSFYVDRTCFQEINFGI